MMKMKKEKEDYFETNDLALTTAISLFCSIEAVDKSNERRVFWKFKRNEKLSRILDAYYRRELRVDPAAYFEQLSFIKTRLYSGD